MPTTVLSKLRGGRRLAQIQSVLEKRGLGQLLGPLSQKSGFLTGALPAALPGDQVVAALSELGPLYVRLGREAAARVDVLPPGLIESLARLEVVDAPSEGLADGILRTGLFSDVKVVNKRWVTVLHQKSILEARREFEPLLALAELLEHRLPRIRPPRPTEVLRDLAEQLEREWSLAQRAAALERAHQAFGGDDRWLAPEDAGALPIRSRRVVSTERVREVGLCKPEESRRNTCLSGA